MISTRLLGKTLLVVFDLTRNTLYKKKAPVKMAGA